MKKRSIIALILMLLCFALAFTSCGGTSNDPSDGTENGTTENGGTENGGSESDGSESADAEITGITFAGAEFTYDGTEKSIAIAGTLPEGVSVAYANEKATNAGTYSATATLSGEGYKTKTLTATLKINKADITGITFTGAEHTYDGAEKSIAIAGTLPAGTEVSYTDAKATNAGTYNAVATVTGANYNTLTLNATLKINKIDILGITFDGDTVEYDTEAHSIAIVGNVPAGVIVSYTCNGNTFVSATEVGTYKIVATLTGVNYNTLTLEATLTIKSTEALLNVINFCGVIYFQNDLDGKKLYKYDDGVISKVNNDIAEYFFTNGTDLYYYSSAFYSKSLKKISANGTVSTVIPSLKGEYLTTDGEYLYYAVNGLLTKDAGIWRYKLDGSESEPTRISENKAAYLTVVEDTIYYSNKSNGGHLYSIPVSGGASTLIHEEKVSYIIEDNGILYFDSAKLLGSAIYKYNTTDATLTKMTTDSGKYLAKLGSDIYYINNDLLTSNVFGDGIYKISVLMSGSLPGTKVISATDNGYSSLTSDGIYLYYFKLNDKHLYRYNALTNEEVDLMASFVPPVETVTPSGDSIVTVYNGEVYYTDPTDGFGSGACLYKYNPVTNQHVKVLADSVAGVWFHNGMMYYSTCILTNYALYRMDLSTGEIIKVNSNRCQDLIFEGDKLYYLDVRVTSNAIVCVNIADIGTEVEPEVIYDDKNIAVTGLSKVGDTFYFVINPAIGSQKLAKYTIGASKATDLGETAFEVVAVGDVLYFYDDYDNEIKCYNNGTVTTVISGVTVNDLEIANGKLYYSSKDGKIGVYVYDLTSKNETKISDKVGDGLTVNGGELWFISTAVGYTADLPIHSGNGDYELYCYNGTNLSKK